MAHTAQTTTTTTTTATATKAARQAAKGKAANPVAATAPLGTLAAQVANIAAPVAVVAAPAAPHGVHVLKGAPSLPRNCPAVLIAGGRAPRHATGHTAAAWAALSACLAQHGGAMPAAAALAALAALNHTSFLGYALRSNWLAGQAQ